MESNSAHSALRLALFTAIAPIAWGSTYYVTEAFLPPDRPLFAALLRALPIGLVLLAWRRKLPTGIWWRRSLVLGATNIAAFFVLIFIAAYRLPGGLAATLTAVSPLVVMALAWPIAGERARALGVAGGVVGVVGVALLVLQGGIQADLIGVLASLAAVASSSLGYVLIKRWTPPVDMLTFTSWQLVAGGLMLLPVALIFEGAPPAIDAAAIGGFAWIGIVGTGLANVAWFTGLRNLGAGPTSLIGLINPVVGTLLGVLLAHETFGLTEFGGMALVLAGVLAGQPAAIGLLRTALRTLVPASQRSALPADAVTEPEERALGWNRGELPDNRGPVRSNWGSEPEKVTPRTPASV